MNCKRCYRNSGVQNNCTDNKPSTSNIDIFRTGASSAKTVFALTSQRNKTPMDKDNLLRTFWPAEYDFDREKALQSWLAWLVLVWSLMRNTEMFC